MPRRQGEKDPHFGESDRFDRVAHRVRVGAWCVIVPALVVMAFLWTSPGVAVSSVVLRGFLLYGVMLVVMRLAGKRTLAELSTFDLVVLLIISEAIQPALVADDSRMTTAVLLVLTIVGTDFMLGAVKHKSHTAGQLLDDIPTVLVKDGKLRKEAMTREKIEEDDILEAAREKLGLDSLDQVRFALLERTGGISIIPWPAEPTPRAR